MARTMKAAIVHQFGKPLAIECVPVPGPGPGEMLVCGMAMGYADEQERVNSFDTPRAGVEAFTRWVD